MSSRTTEISIMRRMQNLVEALRVHPARLGRFLRYLRPYAGRVIAVNALALVGIVASLAQPMLTKFIVDHAIIPRNLTVFLILVGLAGALFLLSGLASGARQFLDRSISMRASLDLQRTVFQHLTRLDLLYFYQQRKGNFLYRLGCDVEQVIRCITSVIPSCVMAVPKLAAVFVIVWHLNSRMAVGMLVLVGAAYLPACLLLTRLMRRSSHEQIKLHEAIYAVLSELLSNMPVIKTLGKEAGAVRRYLSAHVRLIRSRLRYQRLEIANAFVNSTAQRLIVGGIACYGGYQVIQGYMTLGSLTAALIYLRQLVGVQAELLSLLQQLLLNLVACERVEALLSEPAPLRQMPQALPLVIRSGAVTLENVSFGYQPDHPVLNEMSVTFPGGAHSAIVGASGQGKTTLLLLAAGLLKPQQGRVLIDGQDLQQVRRQSLRQRVGLVLQEPFLWEGTIQKNIRYGKPHASQAEVESVSDVCGITDMVSNLPDGWLTRVGEGACRLSQGQKQRIALARALISRPLVLLLDESFSALDLESERVILERLRRFLPHSTLLVVSHRASAAAAADHVYRLQDFAIMLQSRMAPLHELSQAGSTVCETERAQGIV